MTDFSVDTAFEDGSVFAGDWSLCQVRLQDDARFPWLILIPRVAGAIEIDDLPTEQRAVLMQEIVRAGAVVRAIGQRSGRPIDKLNVAAMGNVTPQLHVHVIGRRQDDDLWPGPVWGRGERVAYGPEDQAEVLAQISV